MYVVLFSSNSYKFTERDVSHTSKQHTFFWVNFSRIKFSQNSWKLYI